MTKPRAFPESWLRGRASSAHRAAGELEALGVVALLVRDYKGLLVVASLRLNAQAIDSSSSPSSAAKSSSRVTIRVTMPSGRPASSMTTARRRLWWRRSSEQLHQPARRWHLEDWLQGQLGCWPLEVEHVDEAQDFTVAQH
jgi:hypothetical protein